jgi:hypothetical protein
MFFVPFRGRGILHLYLLPSLRLRTRAQTPISSKRFVRFEAIHITWHHRLVYTDAHLFERICEIRVDKQDGAGTHELAYHIRGDAVADEQGLGSFTRRTPMEFPIWDRCLSSKQKQL